MKNKEEKRNHFITERKELMSKKQKKFCTTLNYTEHFLIFVSEVTGCISISAFTSLLIIPVGITSSAIGSQNCAITGGIKKYSSIIKKKQKKHDKRVFLVKYKLSRTEVLISKALIDSNISHDGFVVINNMLKEYDDMKEEIKNLNT